MNKAAHKSITLLMAAVLSGCALIKPDYKRPEVELPAAWKESAQNPARNNGTWWSIYSVPALEKLIAAALAGCMTVGPDYERPQVETPEQWPGAAATETVSSTWWKAYGDPVLDQGIGRRV